MNHHSREPGSLVFLHVPKAAGSSLIYALKRLYGQRNVWIRNGRGWPMDVPVHAPMSARVYAGHMGLGIAERLNEPVTYISLLREPLQRLVSAYFYLQARPRNPLHPLVSRLSLERFLRSTPIDPEFDNGQLRRLIPDGSIIPIGRCTRSHLADVVARCDRAELHLGVSDAFDRSLLAFASTLRWKTPFYWTQNRRVGRPAPTISPEVVEHVLERQALEYDLYRKVHTSLEQGGEWHPWISDRIVTRYQRRNRYWYRALATPPMAMRKIRLEARRGFRR